MGGRDVRYAGGYAVAVGALTLAQWGFFILGGRVPEFESEPIAIGFHLAAEALMALALLVTGAALLRGRRGAVPFALVAYGMLLYTTVNSPGYFAQLGQWPLVLMFAVVLGLGVAAVARLVKVGGAAAARQPAPRP